MNKSELRKIFKEKRDSLSDDEVRLKSLSITEQIFSSIDFTGIKFIHIFLSINRHRELDTSGVISRLRSEFPKIQICVPRMIPDRDLFENVLLLPDSVLEINRLGIPEPCDGLTLDSKLMDIVFVPLLCADRVGHRVGYGKGFYDRFLAECREDCRRVGLSMFPLIERIDDVGEHDFPLDRIFVA
jgi:5-formyltetrahydrofolate cyclo-ligase